MDDWEEERQAQEDRAQADEKAWNAIYQVASVIHRRMDHGQLVAIIRRLVSPDGKPTPWGQLHPDEIRESLRDFVRAFEEATGGSEL